MERLERVVVAIDLCRRLRDARSWCGETHVQKAYFFLQELTGVPTEYEFVFYKHGPFSFDLHEELNAMRADGYLQLVPQPIPYGPKIAVTDLGEGILRRFAQVAERFERQVGFVAAKLGGKGANELERLSTALFVWRESPGAAPEELASQVHELKPHVAPEQARASLGDFLDIVEAAREAGLARDVPLVT